MDLSKIKSDKVLDARGKYCPEPLVLAAKKMREEVEQNQILEIWTEDEAAVGDFTRWCKRTRNEMLCFIEDPTIEVRLSGADIVKRFYIKKSGEK